MANDIFISYSHKDKPIADAVCANLESAGMRCWIAPRDIAPGMDWPTAISNAISECRVMVLIFSANSNSSSDVGRELILAANNNLVIVPFKLDDITPEPGKQYYLARTHWLDAMNPPTQEQIDKLVGHVRAFLVEDGVKPIPPAVKNLPAESINVQSPTRTKDRPGRKRWIWGALISLSVVTAGIFSIIYLPKFTKPASATPTRTATRTATITSTNTPTVTDIPTENPTPLPEWVTEFAEPILSYRETHMVDRATGFEYSMMLSLYDMLDLSGDLPEFDTEKNTMTCTNCRLQWKMWYTDFIIEMDIQISNPGDTLQLYYRGFEGVHFDYEGSISMSSAINELGEKVLVPEEIWKKGDFNNLLIMVKNQSHAVYVNGEPMLISDLPAGWQNGIASWFPSGTVIFDQINVWDLSE